jgi:lysine 2,3-aminomutase
VVRRYPDRALLKPLLACPVYCRFCFRREVVGPDGGLLTEAELEAALDWLAATPAIREVILTGGDPLMLSPRRWPVSWRASPPSRISRSSGSTPESRSPTPRA